MEIQNSRSFFTCYGCRAVTYVIPAFDVTRRHFAHPVPPQTPLSARPPNPLTPSPTRLAPYKKKFRCPPPPIQPVS